MIAFLSLLAAATLLDSLVGCLAPPVGQALARGLLAAVLLFGVYDQTQRRVHPALLGDRAGSGAATACSSTEIQARLPHGASVFQLPYVPFPEGIPQTPVGGPLATYATKYEPLRGYLHSSTLRWSYGAMKGRSDDWAAQLAGQPLSLVTAAVRRDRLRRRVGGPRWLRAREGGPGLRAALRSLLGVAAARQPRPDLWFFDLRPYRAGLERSAHAGAAGRCCASGRYTRCVPACVSGGLALINPSAFARAATLTVHFSRPHRVASCWCSSPGELLVGVSDLAPRSAPVMQVLFAALTDAAELPFEQAGQGTQTHADRRPDRTAVSSLTAPHSPPRARLEHPAPSRSPVPLRHSERCRCSGWSLPAS